MDVKVASYGHDAGMMMIFLFGVFFIFMSPIVTVIGLIENDMNNIIAGGVFLIFASFFVVPFFPYRTGRIEGYKNSIKIPRQGFGIFHGKVRDIRYEKIKEIKVYFKFPRTDLVDSVFIDAGSWTTLKLFGKVQSTYEQLLYIFSKKSIVIKPKNWNARRKITWKDPQMYVPYVVLPLLLIGIVAVPFLMLDYLGVQYATYIVSLTLTIIIVGIIMMGVMLKRGRLDIEDRYVKDDDTPPKS